MSRTYRGNQKGSKVRRVRVRGDRHAEIDKKALSRALITHALQQAAKEAAARKQPPTKQSGSPDD